MGTEKKDLVRFVGKRDQLRAAMNNFIGPWTPEEIDLQLSIYGVALCDAGRTGNLQAFTHNSLAVYGLLTLFLEGHAEMSLEANKEEKG